MQIVIALFDRFAALDAVGPHQVLTSLPGAEVIFASERGQGVTDETGTLTMAAQASFADVPHPDIVLVPGGPGQAAEMTPGPLQRWLIEADKASTWTTSVCTGALVLAGAGLLAAALPVRLPRHRQARGRRLLHRQEPLRPPGVAPAAN